MNHILLKDGKAWAVKMPNRLYKPWKIKDYQRHYNHAIDNALPFDEHNLNAIGVVVPRTNRVGKWVPFIMTRVKPYVYEPMEENKLYPCPDGYRIKIGIWCDKDCMGMCGECSHAEKFATLKPVER